MFDLRPKQCVCEQKKMSARACTITGRVALTLALPAHAHVRFIQQICAIHKTSLNNVQKNAN